MKINLMFWPNFVWCVRNVPSSLLMIELGSCAVSEGQCWFIPSQLYVWSQLQRISCLLYRHTTGGNAQNKWRQYSLIVLRLCIMKGWLKDLNQPEGMVRVA